VLWFSQLDSGDNSLLVYLLTHRVDYIKSTGKPTDRNMVSLNSRDSERSGVEFSSATRLLEYGVQDAPLGCHRYFNYSREVRDLET
jgi:hypothetical protein